MFSLIKKKDEGIDGQHFYFKGVEALDVLIANTTGKKKDNATAGDAVDLND